MVGEDEPLDEREDLWISIGLVPDASMSIDIMERGMGLVVVGCLSELDMAEVGL